MATTTMGTTTPVGKRNINRGVYWAIAAVIAVILAFAFVASRDRNTTVYDSTPTSGVNYNNSATPGYNADGTVNNNAATMGTTTDTTKTRPNAVGTTDTIDNRDANRAMDANSDTYHNSPKAGPETSTDSRSTTERPQEKR
jgi:hypothetical protein